MSKKKSQNIHRSIVEQIIQIAGAAIIEQERINEAVLHTLGIVPLDERPIRPMHILGADGFSFVLFDQAVSDYDLLLERLLQREGWSEKYSEDYLDKALQRLLSTLLQEGQNKQEHAQQLFTKLYEVYISYSREYTVYVPVSGLTLADESFRMGNILLRKVTDNFLDDLAQRIDAVTLLSLNIPEEKNGYMQVTKQRLQHMRGYVCAEFSVVAEAQRAVERAEEEVRVVLNLLRYSTAVLYSRGLRVAVGLQGEVQPIIRTTAVLSKDGQNAELLMSHKGPLCPFDLCENTIASMERIGILTMARLLEEPVKQTDFEQTVLRSIHWFATAQTQVEGENELLNLITSLETLFAPPDNRSITAAVAEGTARILTTQLERRKAIVKRINDLYGMRSGISHGGKKAVLEQDLVELRAIVKEIIYQMIERKDKFSSQKQFASWLIERRLVG